jgi:Zn-dependent membrane protease YugP
MILFVGTMALSLFAAARVKSVYNRHSSRTVLSGLSGGEAAAVSQVLNAATWTYVAAFVTSLVYFLWHLLPLLSGRDRE